MSDEGNFRKALYTQLKLTSIFSHLNIKDLFCLTPTKSKDKYIPRKIFLEGDSTFFQCGGRDRPVSFLTNISVLSGKSNQIYVKQLNQQILCPKDKCVFKCS